MSTKSGNHHSTEKKLQIRNSTAEFLIFSRQVGEDGIEVRVADETVWLSQKLMASLFDVDVRTISEHLGNLFASTELREEAVIRKFRTTAADGKNYNTQFYNLDAIIAVGFRVNSTRATQFRQWATARLSHFRHTGAGRYPAIEQARAADKTVVPLRGDYSINWIPACAGMTAEVRA